MMVRRLLALTAALMCAASASSASLLTLGVSAGLNMANVSADSVSGDTKYKSGVTVGVISELGLPGILGLRLAPSLVQKGTKLDPTPEGSLSPETSLSTLNLTYLDIPLMLRVGLGHSSWKPFISAGPSLGILLKAEQDSAGTTTDIKPSLDTKELGFQAAAGFEIPMALRTAIAFEGRYNAGIRDIRKSDEGNSLPVAANVHTRGIQIVAAWLLHI